MRLIGGIFIFIILIVAVIILIVAGRGNSGNKSTTTIKQQALVLTDYAKKDANVSMTIDGPVVGNEKHFAMRITISNDLRTIEVLQGYQGNVAKSKSYGNNPQAFDIFLRSLANARFMSDRKEPLNRTDERGVCSTGRRYIFELSENDRSIRRLWSTSCEGHAGTFNGSRSLVVQLFESQISDFNTIMSGVRY